MTAPTKYGRYPYPRPEGSLGKSTEKSFDGVDKNFSLIQASIASIIAYANEIADSVPDDVSARVYSLELSRSAAVYLTAAMGGSTWNMTALAGYPNIRAVVVDPNGESNTLNLPTMSAATRACVTVKCLSVGGGNLTINAGAANIAGLILGGPTLALPYAYVADGVTITTYGLTIIWDGSNWQVIDTAVFVA